MRGKQTIWRPHKAARRMAGWLLVAGLLTACSPRLNWREVPAAGAPLKFLLPCDPLSAQRQLELAQGLDLGPVRMSMTGCDADYATFALSHFLLPQRERAGEVLAAWQAVVMGQLGQAGPAESGLQRLQLKGDGPFLPKGALNLPQSLRLSFEGVGPQGWKLTAHAVWFAQMETDGVRLYHAVIYGDKPRAAAASTFFEGLQLQ
ncbi:hypothetical protein [Comamonas composti]|uniref:hypothetical protein n=1 Tax=Comamonas composti TaxID=408558 RepID=UPI0004127141|nr:hypothetical protein [Comamonas composti]